MPSGVCARTPWTRPSAVVRRSSTSRVVDHANAPPFGSAEQPLRQARAPIPELDHGTRRKVDATALAHGCLVQLKAHPQALHPAQRLVGVINEHAGEGRVSLALGHAHNILGIRLRRVRLHVQARYLGLAEVRHQRHNVVQPIIDKAHDAAREAAIAAPLVGRGLLQHQHLRPGFACGQGRRQGGIACPYDHDIAEQFRLFHAFPP